MRFWLAIAAWAALGISGLPGCSSAPDQAIGRPVALMVFGDSLSAAHGMDESQGWVHLLETQWKQEGFLGAGQSVVNASRSGETTQGGLERLETALDQHRPSHLFIELGANDALRKVPAGETIANIKSMVAVAESRGIKVALARIDLPMSWRFVGGSVVGDVVEQVKRDTRVQVITFPLADVASEKGMMMPDNIHPAAGAQPVLVEMMGNDLARFAGTP